MNALTATYIGLSSVYNLNAQQGDEVNRAHQIISPRGGDCCVHGASVFPCSKDSLVHLFVPLGRNVR